MNDAIGTSPLTAPEPVTTPDYTRQPKGAVEDTGANAIYLEIKHGHLCEVSKNLVVGWKQIEVLNRSSGVTSPKWIKPYKGIEAWVNKIQWYDRMFDGREYRGWKMHMEAGGVNYVLDLPFGYRTTDRFLMTARNINYCQPLEISVWTERETGNMAVGFKQNDMKVEQYYKKGDMKHCPLPVEKVVVGKKTWDWSATLDHLWTEMAEVIIPEVDRCAAERHAHVPNIVTGPQYEEEPVYSGPETRGPVPPDDDIPF